MADVKFSLDPPRDLLTFHGFLCQDLGTLAVCEEVADEDERFFREGWVYLVAAAAPHPVNDAVAVCLATGLTRSYEAAARVGPTLPIFRRLGRAESVTLSNPAPPATPVSPS
jgi:hypothetical protein